MIGCMPRISQESPKLSWKIAQKNGKIIPLTLKNGIWKKNVKSLQFLMVQDSLNPNITFLGEKMWPVAWNKKILLLYKGKNLKCL